MNIEHSRMNPMRVPGWRWERAKSIANGDTAYSRKRDDPLVLRASRFARALETMDTDDIRAVEHLESRYPELFWAHQLAEGESAAMDLMRKEIEARICAAQPLVDIAILTGYDITVIQAFEQIFFNVYDRLKQEIFFRNIVLGASIHTGLHADTDYGLIWKIFGYRGGPQVLDFIISTFNTAQRALSRDGVDAFVLDAIRDNMLRKLLLTIHTIRINNFSASDIMMNGLKMLESERQAAAGGKQSEATILHNIQMCLNQMNFAVGGVGGKRSTNDNKVVQLLDSHGIELPGQRTLAITAGKSHEQLQEFTNVGFPTEG